METVTMNSVMFTQFKLPNLEGTNNISIVAYSSVYESVWMRVYEGVCSVSADCECGCVTKGMQDILCAWTYPGCAVGLQTKNKVF